MQRKRGLELARPFGFPLLIHGSWFPAAALTIVHLTITMYGPESFVFSMVLAIVTTLVLFGSVVVHELAHNAAATVLGTRLAGSTLYPFGGIARYSEPARGPFREMLIALAGPVTSAALAAAFFAGSQPFDGLPQDILLTIGIANGALAALNLLPGLPLDGGTIASSVVWLVGRDRHAARRMSARAGQFLGAALVIAGVALAVRGFDLAEEGGIGLWTALAGVFVYALAGKARRAAVVTWMIEGETVGSWARPFAGRLAADAPLPADGGPYAVSEGGRLAGVLTAKAISTARGGRVDQAMVRWSPDIGLSADEPLSTALRRLSANGTGALVVLDERGVVRGILDEDTVTKRLEAG